MPEQLKECPACGSDNVECLVCTINADEKQDVHFHIACESCYTSGPIADNGKIAADKWNSLPRRPDYNDVDCAGCPERRRSALTWTTEPPKVPGWYWWRWAKYQGWMCLAVRDGLIVEHPRKVLRHAQDIGGQWAGPIAPPGEDAKNAYCK